MENTIDNAIINANLEFMPPAHLVEVPVTRTTNSCPPSTSLNSLNSLNSRNSSSSPSLLNLLNAQADPVLVQPAHIVHSMYRHDDDADDDEFGRIVNDRGDNLVVRTNNTNRGRLGITRNQHFGTTLGQQARNLELAKHLVRDRHIQKNDILTKQFESVKAIPVVSAEFVPDERLAVVAHIAKLRNDIEDLTLQDLYNQKKTLKNKVAKSAGKAYRRSAFSAGFDAVRYLSGGGHSTTEYNSYIADCMAEYPVQYHAEFRKGHTAFMEQYTEYVRARNRS